MAEKNKPAHVVRYGAIHATIWRNSAEGVERFNVTVHRVYRAEDEWRRSESFGRNDLLAASKALDTAHSWISEQERKGESHGE